MIKASSGLALWAKIAKAKLAILSGKEMAISYGKQQWQNSKLRNANYSTVAIGVYHGSMTILPRQDTGYTL